MLQAEINFFTVLIAAVINMVIGFIWYSPGVFGRSWMEVTGKTQDDLEEMKKEASKAYAFSFLGALVMSYVLAHFVYYLQATNIMEGIQIGSFLWLGFVATTTLNSYLFEGKSKKLLLINAGYYLVALIVMAVIQALMSA